MLVGGWSKGPAFPVTGRRVVIMMDKEGVNETCCNTPCVVQAIHNELLDIMDK
jgi:hypothetical protein